MKIAYHTPTILTRNVSSQATKWSLDLVHFTINTLEVCVCCVLCLARIKNKKRIGDREYFWHAISLFMNEYTARIFIYAITIERASVPMGRHCMTFSTCVRISLVLSLASLYILASLLFLYHFMRFFIFLLLLVCTGARKCALKQHNESTKGTDIFMFLRVIRWTPSTLLATMPYNSPSISYLFRNVIHETPVPTQWKHGRINGCTLQCRRRDRVYTRLKGGCKGEMDRWSRTIQW